MKPLSSLLIAAAFSLTASTAMAACPDTSASAGAATNNTAGIAKDGTHAPLESADSKATAGTDTSNMAAAAPKGNAGSPDNATTGSVAKDGATMPLAEQEGGGNKDLAVSQQDVEAQQQGDETAAATADDGCKE
jgi:hypothetical protein